MTIVRNPLGAQQREHDVIIVGGGIHGITLALEAGRRGLKTLLLEKGDFGEQTSFNSLKIIHGGLRYLQSLDLQRFRESVGERSWFLRHYPHRVFPLPCFMPLYGQGARRPLVFRAALLMNHLLSLKKNAGLDSEHTLSMGKVVGVNACRKIFPMLDCKGLKGGAVWYDAFMPDSQLLIMDLLSAACDLGTMPLNYVQAKDVRTDSQGRVCGVSAVDKESGKVYEYHAGLVINAAGPWCRIFLNGLRGDKEELFRPFLMWNALFTRKALSRYALAVQGREKGSRLFFITPWKGKIFAGTAHEPWSGEPERPLPTSEQIHVFIRELNNAVPGLHVERDDIGRIFAGLVPGTVAGGITPTRKEVIIDHGSEGGPSGLYSVGGIKFTTARLVAEKILTGVGLGSAEQSIPRGKLYVSPEWDDPQILEKFARVLAEDSSIVHLDDLVLRRSTLWERGEEALGIVTQLSDLFPWDDKRKSWEIRKCREKLRALP